MLNNYIEWENLGSFPAQKGYSENKGTAGHLQGILDGKLVVGGGANFPEASILEGGQKVTHRDLYLISEENGNLEFLQQIQLDYPIAYGSSTSSEDAIYYLGGSPEEEHNSSITKVYLENGKLAYEEIAKLPMSIENAIAEYIDGQIYFGIGKLGEDNSRDFYRYDLEKGNLESLERFPGEARNQCISCCFENKIAVFGGGSNVAYTDGYLYSIEENSWEEISEVQLNGESISLLGAGVVKLNEEELLAIGGFNKDLWKEAVHKLSTLTGDEKQEYRRQYFGQEPEKCKWNKEMLVYNVNENKWRSLGKISFDAPCGNALLKSENKIYSIMGEIKPGKRTPYVHRLTL